MNLRDKLATAKQIINDKKTLLHNDFGLFIRTFFSHHFNLKFGVFQNELIHDLSQDIPNKRMVRIAPRGHGKTTIIAMVYPLWCIATKRKRSIVIIGSNQTLANEKMQGIIGEIESNDLLRAYYQHLKPAKDYKKQYVKYTDNHVVFEDGYQVVAKGMGSAIRGMKPRPDLVIIDDPEKDTDLNTPNIRERNKNYFDNVVRFLGGPGSTLDIIAIDTLKHFDSLIQYIYNKQGWDSKRYSAVMNETDVLWDSVYCYSVDDLTPFEKNNWSRRGSVGYEHIRIPFYGTWFENDTDQQPKIVGIADDNNTSFIQEFLSMPILLDAMPLRKELWKYFEYTDGIVDKMSYRVGYLDPSMGKNDFQAICILGELNNEFYLLDAALTKLDLGSENYISNQKNLSSLADLVILFMKLYRLNLFAIENNGSQALFINVIYQSLMRERQKGVQISTKILGIPTKKNKMDKISSIFGLCMQNGIFYIRSDYAKQYPDVMRQCEFYPKGDHDDAPDVISMAIEFLQKKTTGGYK